MPHQFMSVNCNKCGDQFCPVCNDDKCPKCGTVDIRDEKTMQNRRQMRRHMDRESISHDTAVMIKKILIFDADEMLRNMYVTKFRNDGFEIEGYEHPPKDPDELVRFVVDHQADLILMDIIMPVINGYTAIAIIKKAAQTKNIPLFIVSNMGMAEDVAKGKQLGADKYLIKANLTPTELVDEVRATLKMPLKRTASIMKPRTESYRGPSFFQTLDMHLGKPQPKAESLLLRSIKVMTIVGAVLSVFCSRY